MAAPFGSLPGSDPRGDVLVSWAERTARGDRRVAGRGTLRFVFYGRVSTEDWQDPVTSRARQREQAEALVRGHGVIVAEFFDVGESRTVAWARRPQAAALVAQLADPDRGWDAVVIGEYERAFYGSQYAAMAPLFEHYGVQLWMPEAGGRVDYQSEHDEKTMTCWACRPSGRSPGPASGSAPRWPSRPGSRAATWAAVRRTGTGSLMRGRTRTRRTPRGAAARTGWNPTRRPRLSCGGSSPSGWPGTRSRGSRGRLNEAGVPCPSAADPARNPHRTGAGWTLGTVTTILSNPRYTGRQVWNRQRTDTELADPANVTLGHKARAAVEPARRVGHLQPPAHPALVSEADFVAAQDINAARGPVPPDEPVLRRYLLAGLLACGVCGRRMESAWSNGKPAYRCRHGRTSAMAPDPARPKNTYIREDKLLPHLPALHLLLTDPCRARPAPHPRRSRRNGHREPGRGDRVPARARDHPHLEPGRRRLQARDHRDCQDRHRESKLTRLQSPDQEGGESTERRSPGAGGSLRAGDDPACPETGDMGNYCVRGGT